MRKRILTLFLCLIMLTAMCTVFAANSDSRVAIGADLSESQIQDVYRTFGISRGDVPELTVTNFDEMKYLSEVVDQSTIGTRAISCIYIETTDEGSGLDVSTNNINWCTPETYRNALTTAGITDADVKITAPFPVSGTAALTGIYKAYEDITGEQLDEQAKIVGTEELAISSELANEIGDEAASSIIHDMKAILRNTENMSDEELRISIIEIATFYNIQLTEEQTNNLVTLARSLQGLDSFHLEINISGKDKTSASGSAELEATANNGEQQDQQNDHLSFGQWLKNLFQTIGDFFRDLFSKGNEA